MISPKLRLNRLFWRTHAAMSNCLRSTALFTFLWEISTACSCRSVTRVHVPL